MKKITKITGIMAVLIAAIVGIAATEHSSGIAGVTGSPRELTCAQSGCHDTYGTSPNIPGTGSITITSTNMNMDTWEYIPGTTYHMLVTIVDSGSNSNNLFGFDLEALSVADTISVGQLVVTSDTSKLLNATIGGKVRHNITHNGNNPAQPGPTYFSFRFDWTAPSVDSGYIKFYVAGVSADGDGEPDNDFVFSTYQLIGGPSVLGTHDLIKSGAFNIYPNPVNSNCNIRFAAGTTESKCDIQLYDLTGSLVQSSSMQMTGNEITDFKIANNVTPGVYLMRLTTNGSTSTQKLIVSKD